MSQRDRLLARPRPSTTYTLRVEDDTEQRRRLEDARRVLHLLQAQGDEADQGALTAAREELDQAEEELEACYEHIVLRAMRPRDFETLIAEHPAREGTEDKAWNVATFPEACFLACAEGEMSAADWEQFLAGNVSDVERADLYTEAIRVNARLPVATLPKDWMQTRS
ncbi:hypothetical protein Ssi03_76100 [Sphaerisporangium siamense]|uniref:Uncharacterized protein n=1 Tax=Sphaerisporangium siamense TaxID=795645 RepID=A0A7W7D4Q9_9ACTN|nr:hypothetical protein [Sphaerisporangium siamense]MBB4699290.1 hypothetical protein [Sphaerisporangium siamense]GII89620.1 hypothetical protein Ssi03_76100 [Sphaerisporangium siamense]